MLLLDLVFISSRKCPIKVWWSFSFRHNKIDTELSFLFQKAHSPTTSQTLSSLSHSIHHWFTGDGQRWWTEKKETMKIREIPRTAFLILIYSIARLSPLQVSEKRKAAEKKKVEIKCQKGAKERKSEKRKNCSRFSLACLSEEEFLIFQGIRV